MVLPDCNVLAPPVVILLFATLLAPPSTAFAIETSAENKTAANAAVEIAISAKSTDR